MYSKAKIYTMQIYSNGIITTIVPLEDRTRGLRSRTSVDEEDPAADLRVV
jgi:hypothetical protein